MFALDKLCRGIAAAAMIFFASGAFAKAMSEKPLLDAEAAANDPNRPLWMRYPAISPDASRIAFSYHGQIWIVDASGGEAVPLTGGLFYSVQPVWSPDGAYIAFASTRYGNFDIFVMPSRGGRITRLTYHSSPDTPCAFSADGRRILFESVRLGNASVSYYNGLGYLSRQIYSVPVGGGRESIVLPTPAHLVRPSGDGRHLAYTNRPSIEQFWRKHAVSDAAMDVWVYDTQTRRHRQLTDFRGEDRNPVWGADGRTVYYLSELSGSFNVWSRRLDGSGQPVQITYHRDHPVRFLSAADDGTLAYGFDGEIYRLDPGSAKPIRVPIRVSQGDLIDGLIYVQGNQHTTEIVVSPTQPELALVVRGDIFVVSTLTGSTRRVTSTPQAERSVSFRPDGRALLYAGERDGDWDIFETNIVREGDSRFLTAVELAESKVISTGTDCFAPAYSPDGARIAYLENRTALTVFDRLSGKSKVVLPGELSYSYQDGDMSFDWSPDGRWIVSFSGSIAGNPEITLIDVSGEVAPKNISRSGYFDVQPQFGPDGKTIYWLTDRDGLRSSESGIAQLDVYAAFLNQESFDRFRMSTEQYVQSWIAQEGVPESAGDAPLDLDFASLRHRTVRLTPFSLNPFFVKLTPDNENLIVVTVEPPSGFLGYLINLRTGEIQQIFSRPPFPVNAVAADDSVSNLYFVGPTGIEHYNLQQQQASVIPFNAEIAYDVRGEVRYIFEHVWRLTQQKFYDSKMHGVDWRFYRDSYAKFLPHIYHWEDFAELLSEMVGELNASHTGSRFSGQVTTGDNTASLGLYYDHTHRGPGMRVAEVLPGGPSYQAGSRIAPGATILKVDGIDISADMDIYPLLNRKEGRQVTLTVRPSGSSAIVEETVTPVSLDRERQLAYERWVDNRREMTDKLSSGRVGYLHIAAMGLPDFQRFFSELFGESADKEAVVIDVRFNLGGNLHDQLIAALTGEPLGRLRTNQGVFISTVPSTRWTKPSAVIANAMSYSDGSVFPFFYQRQDIGPVVGERVPGTGTAVWWEAQQESRLTYGVPQLGFQGLQGHWLENREIVPDVLVYNDPDSIETGRDLQLEAAVKALLDKLEASTKQRR